LPHLFERLANCKYVYNKYEVFNFISHSNAGLKHDSLGSCKIKFSRKILISLTYQTQYLLISIFFMGSSYAYPTKGFIETGNIVVINSDEIIAQTIKNTASGTASFNFQDNMQSRSEITSHAITRSLEYIADNSQITKSISTNAQGADSKTYRIKPAKTSPKVYDHDQVNKLNMNTMKWESELKSIELVKSGSHNSISNPKFR